MQSLRSLLDNSWKQVWCRFRPIETWISEGRIQKIEEIDVVKVLADGFSQVGNKYRQGLRKYSVELYLKKERQATKFE